MSYVVEVQTKSSSIVTICTALLRMNLRIACGFHLEFTEKYLGPIVPIQVPTWIPFATQFWLAIILARLTKQQLRDGLDPSSCFAS